MVGGTVRRSFILIACLGSVLAFAGDQQDWLAAAPTEQREALAKRLDGFVKANRAGDWGKLFDLISDAGRGGVDRRVFVTKLKAAHRSDFATSPDLLDFQPVRSVNSGSNQYDVYGCGKATREGRSFNGVALVHAVFEHNNWFFSGWTFTEFPNEPCKALSNRSWETPAAMEWNQPMEELRTQGGTPFHVDPKK